jgi:hypothetical protein
MFAPQHKRNSECFTCEVPNAQIDTVQQLPAHLHGHGSMVDGDGRRQADLERVDQTRLAHLQQQSEHEGHART